MTTNGRPGVFIDENFSPLSTGSPGIPGEATPAFAAAYPRGPVNPQLVGSWSAFVQAYGGFSVAPGNLLPFAVYEFFQNGGNSCYVLRVPNTDATPASVTLDDIDTPDPNDVLTVTALSPGVWGESIFVEVVSAGAAGRATVNIYLGVTTPAGLVETYPDVSMNPADSRNLAVAINTASAYVQVATTFPANTYDSGVNDLALIAPTPLSGGNDGVVAPNMGTAVPPLFDQLQGYILNLNLPGVTNYTVVTAIADWAAGRNDVMLVVDGPVPGVNEVSSTVAAEYVALVQGSNPFPASTFVSLYAPWVLVPDPSSTISGATRLVPPGGLVLGQWQQNDVQYGVQKTPAGVNNTLSALGLEVRFTSTDLDSLNNAQVNALQFRPGNGYCIFGGRTLHPGYPDRYIAVRRTLMMLEHDLQFLTQFALFEPNDDTLWTQISSVMNNYLNTQYQAGVLSGASATDAYSVTCDATVNSEAAAAAGIVTALAAVNIGSPAEWLTITVSQIQSTGTSSATT